MPRRNARLAVHGRRPLAELSVWVVPSRMWQISISRATACKWLRHRRTEGAAGLPSATGAPAGPARLGPILVLLTSTVHRILTLHGLNRLDFLDRPTGQVIRRCELRLARPACPRPPRLLLGRGQPLDAANVRRAFRQAVKDIDGIDPDEWTPRELRHSFVSLLSDQGVPLEEILWLVGHSGTAVTEEVYRKQIRPVIQTGAVVMDGIIGP